MPAAAPCGSGLAGPQRLENWRPWRLLYAWRPSRVDIEQQQKEQSVMLVTLGPLSDCKHV